MRAVTSKDPKYIVSEIIKYLDASKMFYRPVSILFIGIIILIFLYNLVVEI